MEKPHTRDGIYGGEEVRHKDHRSGPQPLHKSCNFGEPIPLDTSVNKMPVRLKVRRGSEEQSSG